VDELLQYLAAKDANLSEAVQQIFHTQPIEGDALLGLTMEKLHSCKMPWARL